MKKTFTPSEIMANRGCYDRGQVESLSFIKDRGIHIKKIIKSEIRLKDAYWFLFRKCELELKHKLELSRRLAWVVLPVYEKHNPNDNRVKDCLIAIDKFNKQEISAIELKKYATDVADAAATVATVAVATVAVAVAAVAYAYATDVADAADATSTYAATVATNAVEIKQKLIEETIKFIDEL